MNDRLELSLAYFPASIVLYKSGYLPKTELILSDFIAVYAIDNLQLYKIYKYFS